MSVVVEPFTLRDATDADLAAWFRLLGQGQTADLAARSEYLRGEPATARRWVARADGRIRAAAEVRQQPHDRTIGFLRLHVAPTHRRRGIGTRLLAQVLAETERVQATVFTGPPGEPFVRGWRVLLRLELHEQCLDRDVIRRCQDLATRSHPNYQVVSWRNAAPEGHAPSFGRVMAHVLDAPGAALQMPSRSWDTAAVRAWEASMGPNLLVSALIHLDEVVAATVTTVPDPATRAADQHDTAVLPAHRGRGLARWLKARQTLRLHELFPTVETVTVTVNRENAPMLAVNRAVGYRFVRGRLLVEHP